VSKSDRVLLFDIGNSFAKFFMCELQIPAIHLQLRIPTGELKNSLPPLLEQKNFSHLFGTSVVGTPRTVLKQIGANFVEDVPIPFSISYTNPQQLGADRLALFWYAWAAAQPQHDVHKLETPISTTAIHILIDEGTATTIDWFDTVKNKAFPCVIMPGLTSGAKALRVSTDALPCITEQSSEFSFKCRSTEESIRNGLWLQRYAAINWAIDSILATCSPDSALATVCSHTFNSHHLATSVKLHQDRNAVAKGLYSAFIATR